MSNTVLPESIADNVVIAPDAPELVPDALAVPFEEVATIALESVVYHKPGAALETQADKDACEARYSEPVLDTVPEPIVSPPATETPAANFASRNNIVAAGPGSVADFL